MSLVDYDADTSGESSDNEINTIANSKQHESTRNKRKIDEYLSSENVASTTDLGQPSGKARKSALPLPPSILGMFKDEQQGHEDDSGKHDGRIRSFPHEAGNWATYVYIPFLEVDFMSQLVDVIIDYFKPDIDIKPIDDFHVSLSKTVALRYHWIKPFTKSLSHLAGNTLSFQCSLGAKLKLYTNDDKSRTFFGLRVNKGASQLCQLVAGIDKCVNDFNLPVFYAEPSFHISIVWCLGDVTHLIESEKLVEIEGHLIEVIDSCVEKMQFDANELRCRSGNRNYHYSFKY